MTMSDLNSPRTEISSLGEFGLIDRLTEGFSAKQSSTIKSIGDDCAVISVQPDRHLLLTTDMLVEGVHFDLMYMPLKHLGYKCVVVNLSDIYAMNGVPRQITVSIAVSNRFSLEALEELYDGIRTACETYGVDLVGGDTCSSQRGLILSVTATGFADPRKIVYRSGAKPGDVICVSGDLGAAYLGLQILEREKQLYLSNPGIQPDLEDQQYLIGRQLKPEARRDIIDLFSKKGLQPTTMIDLSDGLSSDLIHICKHSRVGAYIEERLVPIRTEAELMALKFNLDPITCALHGGEDYELLFTLDPGDIEKIKYLTDIYMIGEVTSLEDGITLHTTGGNIVPITAQGWTHFGKGDT